MTLKELYDEVARRADTPKLKVTAADVSRVISQMFGVLAEQETDEALALLAKGLAKAREKATVSA